MPLALSPVVGTIRIEPLAGDSSALAATDDSSVGQLLSDFASRENLQDGDEPLCLIATRLSRCGLRPDAATAIVRADLARLLEDLDAEYEELQSHAT